MCAHKCAGLAPAALSAALACASASPAGFAQQPPPAGTDALPSAPTGLETVTVTATRVEQPGFDVPASIDSFGVDPVAAQRPGVNLSEELGRVPGVIVRNRQNYAQDLQVSSRGFGARAAFGVRGVRLAQDGIPFTMPDGQGQTGLFDLDSVSRIEVLRGPFAALYGNSAGGLVSLFTAAPPQRPTLRFTGGAGSHGSWKAGAGFGATAGALGLAGHASRFETDGYRDHSSARRDLLGAKLAWEDPSGASRFALNATMVDQPDTQDPLGLTREQLDEDPTQAGTGAFAFGARKSVDHRQVGMAWQRRLGPRDTLTLRAHAGDRRVAQYLAFSGAGEASSGGVVDLDRGFGGLGLEWTRKGRLAGGPVSLTLGADYDRMDERRRGYVNESGTAGALRRSEMDTAWNFDQYAIAEWRFAERWRLAGGARHSSVRFQVDDDYVTAVNPDDSGRRDYSATRPVIGLLHAVTDSVNLYVAAGRGFETPTFAELAYRPDGQPGPNFALEASTNTSVEAGVKARIGHDARIDLALFRTTTRNDIVPDANVGGRTTFRNAARTTRWGMELGIEAKLGRGFDAWLAYTWIDAEFRDYTSLAGVDLSGNALPGVPRSSVYVELAWQDPRTGLATALETQRSAKVPVDDANSASADSYSVVSWRLGYDWMLAGWRVVPYLRVDNLFDRRYVGSVIVNAANGRYYEPAPQRSFFAGAKISRAF